MVDVVNNSQRSPRTNTSIAKSQPGGSRRSAKGNTGGHERFFRGGGAVRGPPFRHLVTAGHDAIAHRVVASTFTKSSSSFTPAQETPLFPCQHTNVSVRPEYLQTELNFFEQKLNEAVADLPSVLGSLSLYIS